MTAMDDQRELNSVENRIREIEHKISEAGVEYIYYQLVTLSGRTVAKVVPAHHLRRNLIKGVQFHATAMVDLHVDRTGRLLGGGVEAREVTAIPDIDTFAVLPWDHAIATFLCLGFEPEHTPEIGGEALGTDPRGTLLRAHKQFTADTGYVLKSGCEPEMSWLGKDIEVTVRPGGGASYQLANLELMRPIYKKVMAYADALGFDMIEGDYEDPGQLELNWMFDDCHLTADRLIMYRQICHQVAKEHGVKASFMPKPTTGSMGNGCHHNVSLWEGDTNVLEEPGRRELHLTTIGQHALGGMLANAADSIAIMASTVNSYKRFWDGGQFAPSLVNWGMDNKTCTVRLSAVGRLEYKIPDSAVNPYLSHTAILAAMKDGLDNSIDPGPPQVGSSYEGSDDDVLPLTLGDAVAAFTKSKVIKGAFDPQLADFYAEVKFDEWARACGAVTEFDREMYLEFL